MKHHEAMYITVFAKLNVHQFPLHSDNRQTQYRPTIPRSKIYDRAHSQGLRKHNKCWPFWVDNNVYRSNGQNPTNSSL